MWRGLSCLMNSAVHLDSQISKKHFCFMLRTEPETIIKGHVGTGGRIRFKTFGATAIVCIEMKFKIGNDEEHVDAIAQVIVECDGTLCTLLHHSFCRQPLENTGCDLNNTKAGFLYQPTVFSVPDYPSNPSSSKECVDALSEIQYTSGVACDYPTSMLRRLLFLSFFAFAARL